MATQYKIFVMQGDCWKEIGESEANNPEKAVEKLLKSLPEEENPEEHNYAACPVSQWTSGPAAIERKVTTSVKFKSNRTVKPRAPRGQPAPVA